MEFSFLYACSQKQLLEVYQIEEIENNIHEAMEFATNVKLTVWDDGFFHEFEGMINRLDGIGRFIYLALTGGEGTFERIRFEDIVSIEQREVVVYLPV
jgi:hypothetical protein